MRLGSGQILYNRGVLNRYLGRYEAAIQDLDQACQRLVNRSPALLACCYYQCGLAWMGLGRYKMTGRCMDLALQLRQDAAAYNLRGIAHHELGQVVPAIRDYNLAIQLTQDMAAAYINRAAAHLERGDSTSAWADLETTRTLAPQDAVLYANRGLAFRLAGKLPEADRDFRRCLELRSQLRPLLDKVLARLARGQSPLPEGKLHLYRAATPEEALQRLVAAEKDDDPRSLAETLASPLGPLFVKLLDEAAHVDAAHTTLMGAVNKTWGNFAPIPRGFAFEPQQLAKGLIRQQRLKLSALTILKREGDTTRQLLTVRKTLQDADGITWLRDERFVALKEGDNWKLVKMIPSSHSVQSPPMRIDPLHPSFRIRASFSSCCRLCVSAGGG